MYPMPTSPPDVERRITLLPRPCGYPASPTRIALSYWWRHGRWPALREPRLFTECVQWRKLNDRDARMPLLADKVAVKAVVADVLGPAWITPTLWHGTRLPAVPPCPLPLVVKARHGCGQVAFVRSATDDWQAVRRRARRWMRGGYGGWLDEWVYRAIPRGLLIEPFVGEAGALPVDYKFYVFAGEVAAVQVHLARERRHRWHLFDPAWRAISAGAGAVDVPPPRALHEMLAAARTLGRGFDFVRVDLYDLAAGPRFGELTFYPGSGYDPFEPRALDHRLGVAWRTAAPQIGAGLPG